MKKQSFIEDIETTIIKHWDLPALSDYKKGPITYGEVGERIAKLHILFEQCGIKKGDHIALCGRNSASWAISFFSIISYGAIVVPILHEFKPQAVEHLIFHSDSKMLIVGDMVWEGLNEEDLKGVDAVIQMQDYKLVYCQDEQIRQAYDKLEDNFNTKYAKGFQKKDVRYMRENPNDLAIINYTSGTTSISKGVMIPYKALLGNYHFAKNTMPEITQESNTISMLPMAHMYSLSFELIFEFFQGAHIHLLTRVPSPKIVAEAFTLIKPELIISVPLIIEKIYKTKLKPILDKRLVKILLSTPIIDKVFLTRIQTTLNEAFGGRFIEVIVGGAAMNQEVEAFFKKINFRYTIGYGMTECAPIICYAHWDKTKIGSCGKPVDGMKIRIDSSSPETIPGEILVKGTNVMMGYYKNEQATKEALHNGWLHTGDLGVMDKDGYLYIKGRSKNMILSSSGQNIYPEEIEDKLNSMEYVNESLVMEKEGKIVALINLDQDKLDMDNISRDSYNEILEKIRQDTNKEIPAYEQISQMIIQPEEFERTPKRSIKRYIYYHK
jgi:long-chain acyl-CoA synthetase